MIKAELNYNPYLMEIGVRFNGQPPHINSLVEKYRDTPLQDWIDQLPQIFHDEMNGYYFELDFSGTALDCDEVTKAFRKAGVSEKEVPVFLKNKLGSREDKIKAIDELLKWLDENRYRKFDAEAFRQEHMELFEGDFHCIVIHGISRENVQNISAESVSDISELDEADLTHMPLLYCISEDTVSLLGYDMEFLLNRHDVTEEQVFFCLSDDLDRASVIRHITDLGVSEPKIVTGLSDDAVHKYFMLYPVSDYISSAINVFRETINNCADVLSEENEKSKVKNNDVLYRLRILDNSIMRIKTADTNVTGHDSFEYPADYHELVEELKNRILGWESRLVKITDPKSAANTAVNLNAAAKRYFRDYCSFLKKKTTDHGRMLRKQFIEWYAMNGIDTAFMDNVDFTVATEQYGINEVTQVLLSLKEEKYVNVRNNIFSKFESNGTEQNTVLVTTYYMKNWRAKILDTVIPVAERIAINEYEHLKKYSEELADAYHGQLMKLKERQLSYKAEASAGLSNDERLLQQDNDWLNAFADQLKKIERS